ncbi:type I polyketide synthase [Paenibacillus zanthoxyli]|uniref:type I polyketide synthase n=1 Tax=Paenibacillus zanthoxyli TaxID=369399 RepID=UPI000472821C|nr:polyketide synthase [Paenibacillus zanthoxyli]
MSFDIDFADKKTDIAIIGMSIRLPGVENIEQFWKHIKQGDEVVADLGAVSKEGPWHHSDNPRPFIRANNNIKDIEYFDASFFNINPTEASWMDPQHRLFLELAWEALETAGYAAEDRKQLIGVYAGVYANYYSMFHLLPHLSDAQAATNLQMQIASEKDHVATMTAYKLDLTGPVLNVQSACSSSLAAVHLACESLLTYSSDVMICGAATLSIPQIAGYEYQDNGLLSSDGHLRAFDAEATGTLYSEGAGCVVLKRFRDAWEDGDTIYGLIKGSAMNNDGSQKAGFTAPSVKGQIEVIERAMMVSGVKPEQIGYVEAHGTGTPLGDAIELEALHEVFLKSTSKTAFCALGSAKANFGHTGPAAGVIGLIKAVMALKEQVLPPAINVEMPSIRLASGTSPFYLNPIPLEWGSGGLPRYAGVSSFGLGGTNVHVIVEEPPQIDPSVSEREACLFVLSAQTATALHNYKDRVQASLATFPENRLADAAYTLQVGRKGLEQRGFYISMMKSGDEGIIQEPQFHTGKVSGVMKPLTFFFADQQLDLEASYIEWTKTAPRFHEDWTQLLMRMKQAVKYELSSLAKKSQADVLEALRSFAFQIGMSHMWKRWGIVPSYYKGEGAGVYAAATASGWMELEDAAYLYMCFQLSRRQLNPVEQRLWADSYERRLEQMTVDLDRLPDSLIWPGDPDSRKKTKGLAGFELLSSLLHDPSLFHSDHNPPSDHVQLTLGPRPSIASGDIHMTDQNVTGTESIDRSICYCLGWLWIEGYPINWSAYYEGEKRQRIALPTYPFERVRYWVEPETDQHSNSGAKAASELVPVVPLKLSAEQLAGYKGPRSATERILVHLWEKHLGVTPIGTEDNFYELGGNSLLAASINANLGDIFKTHIGLEVFLEHQSIAELAEALESLLTEPIPLKGS